MSIYLSIKGMHARTVAISGGIFGAAVFASPFMRLMWLRPFSGAFGSANLSWNMQVRAILSVVVSYNVFDWFSLLLYVVQ